MSMSKINPQINQKINQIQIKLEKIIAMSENVRNIKDVRRLYRELIELYAMLQSIAM